MSTSLTMTMTGTEIVLATDCSPCGYCGELVCPICQDHYADCPCPGPDSEPEDDDERV